jgi:hypothetical protein
MQINYVKMAIVGMWIAGLAVYALTVNLTSLGGWAFLVGVGALPPAIMLRLWAPPERTMSQDIQEALTPPAYPKSRVARP